MFDIVYRGLALIKKCTKSMHSDGQKLNTSKDLRKEPVKIQANLHLFPQITWIWDYKGNLDYE